MDCIGAGCVLKSFLNFFQQTIVYVKGVLLSLPPLKDRTTVLD